MKVGTDGSLLGAWADTTNCHRALDVGTGTGLIALMLAQRCDAVIDAIDIDIDACDQARENIAQSPFATQIQVHLSPFANYKPKADIKYDLIISNPPYFIDSLKCPNKQRNTARHTDTLSLADLLKDSCRLLAPKGKLALILPFEQRTILLELAHKNQLYPLRETHVSSIKGATPKRLHRALNSQDRDRATRILQGVYRFGQRFLSKNVGKLLIKKTSHLIKKVMHFLFKGDNFRRQHF